MNIKTCFGISSCKGGVGKSTISCNIAITLANQGYKVGLLDADIYGPSVPTLLGIGDKEPEVKEGKFIPFEVFGIKAMSIGFLVNEDQAVVWRGPMLAKGLDGLINKTHWGELDYLIVDTPPGTGDVQLTLLQRIPLTSSIVVTTPQKVAISDCKKGIEMINKLNIPISGLIENMSWFQPDQSEKKYYLFGKDGGKQLSNEYSLDLLAQLPLVELGEDTNIQNNSILKKEFVNITDKLAISVKKIKEKNSTGIPQRNIT